MTDHADTIRRSERALDLIGDGEWTPQDLRHAELLKTAHALLAEVAELHEGVMHFQERANTAEAERRQLQEERDEAQQKFRVECDDRRAAVAERDKAERERRQAQAELDEESQRLHRAEQGWAHAAAGRRQAIDALREARAGYDEFYESGDKTRLLNAESLIRAALVKLGEKPQ